MWNKTCARPSPQLRNQHGRDCLVRVKGHRPTARSARSEAWDQPRRRSAGTDGPVRPVGRVCGSRIGGTEPQAGAVAKRGPSCGAGAVGQRRVGRLDPGGAGVSRRPAGGAGSVVRTATQIATGAVARERWPLLTSRPPERRGPAELLRLFRQHWSIENSLHQVKDRSWDEDRHTLRHPGLGEVFAALVNVSLNVLRRAEWLPERMSLPLQSSCVSDQDDCKVAFRPSPSTVIPAKAGIQ